MKKYLLIIILLIGAVRIHYGQPEYCDIVIEQNSYKLYEANNYLYGKTGGKSYKVVDEKIIDYAIYDIDTDENEEILVITYGDDDVYGRDFIMYDTVNSDEKVIAEEIYRQDFSEIKPWKVDACNLDNDKEADIFIGVHKDTEFYKDVRNRPFFYSWDGESLNKKWLGSFFTNWDLIDIVFGDYYNLGYDAAAVLERRNDDYRVGIYKFVGFGFENISTSEVYTNVKDIETSSEGGLDALTLNFKGIMKNIHITYIKNSEGFKE